MTTVTLEPDPLKDIAELRVRLFKLEQGRGGAIYDTNGAPIFPHGITIGDSAPIYVDEVVPPPTGLLLAWNSNFDEIFIDASWTPPASTQVTTYMVELTKVTGGVGVIDAQGGLGANSYRFRGLEPNTQYSVRVWSYNRIGAPSAATAPVAITTGTDATLPAAPSGLIVTAGIKTLVARWTDNTEVDVARGKGLYEIQVATDAAFTLNLRTFRESATIMSVGDLTTGTTYYVRVRAIDSSGNFSLFSSTANVTPGGTQTGDYGALSIDDAAIANLSAAKVTFGTMSGDRITANTADIVILKTSTLNTQIITIAGTGMFRMGRIVTPFHYVIMDAAGIRFFTGGSAAFTGGTPTMDLNVNTGNAFFGGSLITGVSITSPVIVGGSVIGSTVGTASSGKRIAIEAGVIDRLKLYSGSAGETANAFLDVGTGAGFIRTGWYSAKLSGGPQTAITQDALSDRTLISVFGDRIMLDAVTAGGVGASVELSGGTGSGEGVFLTGNILVGQSSNIWMGDHYLYLRSIGDTNHALLYSPGSDGPKLQGFSAVELDIVNGGGYLILKPNDLDVYGNTNKFMDTGGLMQGMFQHQGVNDYASLVLNFWGIGNRSIIAGPANSGAVAGTRQLMISN